MQVQLAQFSLEESNSETKLGISTRCHHHDNLHVMMAMMCNEKELGVHQVFDYCQIHNRVGYVMKMMIKRDEEVLWLLLLMSFFGQERSWRF